MSRRLVATTAAAFAALALAACGSSGTGTPANPPPGTRTTDPAAPAAPAAPGTPGPGTSTGAETVPASSSASTSAATTTAHQVHVCDLVSAATLAQLSGVPVTKAESDDKVPTGVPLVLSQCNYTDSGLHQVSVTYAKSQFSAHEFDQDFSIDKSVISRTTMVSGIGDKAFTTAFPTAWLEVLWDGATFTVAGATSLSVAQAKTIVTALHDKL